MAYRLDYGKGKIVEMEREELEESFSIPKEWKFYRIEDYLNIHKIKITEQDSREQRIYARLAKVKRPKPKIVKFEVGDTIMLKDYSEYEYPNYKNQEAVIIHKEPVGGGFDWRIKWPNRGTSLAKEDNMIRVHSNGA